MSQDDLLDVSVFNLIAWSLDCVGDILCLVLRRHNYLLGMVMAMGVSSGLTPIVYIIGGWDVVTRAARVSSTDQEHKFVLTRIFKRTKQRTN